MSVHVAAREPSEFLPRLRFALLELAEFRAEVARLPLSPTQKTHFSRTLDSMERRALALLLQLDASPPTVVH
jgi:hypothetical protein